jgi:hypothetical protein
VKQYGFSHIVGEYVLSTTLLKGSSSGQTREKKPVFQEVGIKLRSYAAAEKDDEGMALKILRNDTIRPWGKSTG